MFNRSRSAGLGLAAHFGRVWMIDEGYAAAMELQLEGMTLAEAATIHAAAKSASKGEEVQPGYAVNDEGTAVIGLSGPMTKESNSMQDAFGGCSTKAVGAALATAVADDAVKAIVLVIDSPGGTVDGSFDLAQDVHMANKKKPVHAYIQDNGCSAAYLVASQARSISANVNAIVGSIGVYSVLTDSSKADAMRGVKRHTVYAGEYKAIGAPGREVTDAHVAWAQGRMDKMMGLFAKAVVRGRGLSEKQLASVANGDVFIGQDAVKRGLVDKIQPLHAAVTSVGKNPAKAGSARMEDVLAVKTDEVDLTDVRRWIAQDETEPAAAAADVAQAPLDTPQPPAAAAVAAAEFDVDLTALLKASGILQAGQLASLIARAAVGDEFVAKLRAQTKSLAVIALGPEAGAAADAMADAADVPLLRAMASQYEGIAVGKGLIPKSGAPGQRQSSPSGHPDVGRAEAVADVNSGRATDPQARLAAAYAERASTMEYAL